MATSDVEICNLGLIALGERPIMSLDDPDVVSRTCNIIYPNMVVELLEKIPWNFARREARLPPLADPLNLGRVYADATAYLVPTDSVRIREVMVEGYPLEKWYVLGDKIIALAGFQADPEDPVLSVPVSIDIIYTGTVDNPVLFSSLFVSALSFRIAYQLTFTLADSLGKRDRMEKSFFEFMGQAASSNSLEGISDEIRDPSWITGRQ